MSRSSIKFSSIFIVISLDAEDCRIVSVAKSTLVVETSCLSSLSSSRLCHVCLSLPFQERSDDGVQGDEVQPLSARRTRLLPQAHQL